MNRTALVKFLTVMFLMSLPGLAYAEMIKPSETDSSIRKQVADSLDGTLGEYAVDVRNGEVTIIGTVVSEQDRANALNKAKNVDGVVAVIDELQIDPNVRTPYVATPASYSRTDDASLAENVRYLVKPYRNVSVAADNGTVILSGTVPAEADKDRLTRMACHVAGVKDVKNDVRVEMFEGK